NCESVLPYWSIPLPGDRTQLTGDRHVFAQLREHFRPRATGLATAYYVLNRRDILYDPRQSRITPKLASGRADAMLDKGSLDQRLFSSFTPNEIACQFDAARALHRSGKLQQAEQTYLQVLRASPQHAEALNLFGILLSQLG